MSEATDNVEAAAKAPEATTETSLIQNVGEGTQSNEGAVDRPEWLPEKFKTAQDLVDSYSQLESKLGKSQEELRESILAEIEKDIPESSGAYEVPDELPIVFQNNEDMLIRYAEFAYKNGFSQEEFAENLNELASFIPVPDLKAEREKLGENANARIEAVALWARSQFPSEFQEEILRIGQSAGGVKLLENIMQNLSDTEVNSNTVAPARLTEDDLRSMMSDPRYWNQTKRDVGFIKQVDEGFSKLYK